MNTNFKNYNPMKPHFSFFLVFAFFFASAQKKDTVFRQPDCTKFHQAEKEKFDVLEKDFKKVNFSKLNKLIINHIDESRLKKQNLKISLIKRKMTICGWDIFRDCISKYNLTNNFYNDIHFWSSETVLLLQKKLKKNIPKPSQKQVYSQNSMMMKMNNRSPGYSKN